MSVMPGDLRYTQEKYMTALHTMAIGEGSLRVRLIDAYEGSAERAHPPMAGLGPALPDELAARITALHALLTAREGRDGGSAYEATVSAMTDQEVREAAEELISIAMLTNIEMEEACREDRD